MEPDERAVLPLGGTLRPELHHTDDALRAGHLREHDAEEPLRFYGFPKQTVNGVVHELAEQGYVSLRPGSKDKREKLVCLTETGAAYAKELLAPLYRAEQSVFSVLGEEKIIQMFETISAFNALMEKKLEAEE